MTRASLKASVERTLSTDTIVISDSLNYIKGYRYELFCIARAAGTPICVILCDTPKPQASEWNEMREDGGRISSELSQELTMRFETPNPRNRWDSPLIVITPIDTTPMDIIVEYILQKPGLRPNSATQPQVLSDTNFVHEMERITQDIISTLLTSSALPGDTVSVPHSKINIVVRRPLVMMELRSLRKQFFKFIQLHPVSTQEIGNTFVDYINTNTS